MANAFEAEEQANPSLVVAGKASRGFHLVEYRPGGLSRAACGMRTPALGVEVMGSEHVLPPSWSMALRADDESATGLFDEHRVKLDALLSKLTCASCKSLADKAISAMWARNAPATSAGPNASIKDVTLQAMNAGLRELRGSPGATDALGEEEINRHLVELMVNAVGDRFGLTRPQAAKAILEELERDGTASFGPGSPGRFLRETAEGS